MDLVPPELPLGPVSLDVIINKLTDRQKKVLLDAYIDNEFHLYMPTLQGNGKWNPQLRKWDHGTYINSKQLGPVCRQLEIKGYFRRHGRLEDLYILTDTGVEIAKRLESEKFKGLTNLVSDGKLDSYVLMSHTKALDLEYTKFQFYAAKASASAPKIKAPGTN